MKKNRLRHCVLPIGALEDIDQFDAAFFNISEREAILLDPQQRHILELSWHLFEQAGWQPEQLKQGDIGFTLVKVAANMGKCCYRKMTPIMPKVIWRRGFVAVRHLGGWRNSMALVARH